MQLCRVARGLAATTADQSIGTTIQQQKRCCLPGIYQFPPRKLPISPGGITMLDRLSVNAFLKSVNFPSWRFRSSPCVSVSGLGDFLAIGLCVGQPGSSRSANASTPYLHGAAQTYGSTARRPTGDLLATSNTNRGRIADFGVARRRRLPALKSAVSALGRKSSCPSGRPRLSGPSNHSRTCRLA